MIKKCTICKEEKLLISFNNNKRKVDGLQSSCKECNIKHSKKYYEKNKKSHQEIVRKNKLAIHKRNSQFVWDYLLLHPCIDCGNTNPIVLEFDHVRGDKILPISIMVREYWSLDKIKEEIDKCEVRCANCHRIKTAKDFNWYKNINTKIISS